MKVNSITLLKNQKIEYVMQNICNEPLPELFEEKIMDFVALWNELGKPSIVDTSSLSSCTITSNNNINLLSGVTYRNNER